MLTPRFYGQGDVAHATSRSLSLCMLPNNVLFYLLESTEMAYECTKRPGICLSSIPHPSRFGKAFAPQMTMTRPSIRF